MNEIIARTIALFAAVIALQVADPAWARSPDTAISTGREGGSYFYIAERLKSALLVSHDTWLEVLTSRGSLENLERLADPASKVGLALTQADALSRYLSRHPDFAEKFIVLGDVGVECLFVIARSDGNIAKAADLKTEIEGQISVDDEASGAAVTWEYMTELDPGFRALERVPVDTMEALLQLKVAGSHTKLEAAALVQRPGTNSAPTKVVYEHPDDYRLVSIAEKDVGNSKLPDGSVVYTYERVRFGDNRRGKTLEVDSLCTRGLLLASKTKLDKDLRSRLSSYMLESGDSIVGKEGR